MTRLRIYDLKDNVLALDLRDLLRLFAPRSQQASWMVSAVRSSIPGREWFEAIGEGGGQLAALAKTGTRLSGHDLTKLAGRTRQVIWGEFVGSFPAETPAAWMTIRAIDSTFYEVDTDDEAILGKIRSAYKDIRAGEPAVASWPLGHP